MSTRRYHLLNAILIILLVAGSVWAYPRLPERIPVHFSLSGEPDRWEARSPASWFLLPAIGIVMALVLHAMSVYGARRPEVWNLPEKQKFLALHPPDQAPIIARMQEFMARVGVAVTALFCVIQAGIYSASAGGEEWLPLWVTAGIAAMVLSIGIGAVRLNGAVGRMVRDAHARAVAS
ncbi:MAG TPA: DUF1648 domain-containing protein [Longimicrobium sp.]|nr:DUF1648 domain-containing protein [Longimicrobium sp.]